MDRIMFAPGGCLGPRRQRVALAARSVGAVLGLNARVAYFFAVAAGEGVPAVTACALGSSSIVRITLETGRSVPTLPLSSALATSSHCGKVANGALGRMCTTL